MQTAGDIMCYAANSAISFSTVHYGYTGSNLTFGPSEFEYSLVLTLLLIKPCASSGIIFL
jgi:hypothetical protein